MLRSLLSFARPFHTIAKELTIIRQLYEMELAERKPPIVRYTEKATDQDTEVTYMDVEQPNESKLKSFVSKVNGWPTDRDEDEENV